MAVPDKDKKLRTDFDISGGACSKLLKSVFSPEKAPTYGRQHFKDRCMPNPQGQCTPGAVGLCVITHERPGVQAPVTDGEGPPGEHWPGARWPVSQTSSRPAGFALMGPLFRGRNPHSGSTDPKCRAGIQAGWPRDTVRMKSP